MPHNIKYQLCQAVSRNFREGIDKHSLQKQGKIGDGLIKSYRSRDNIIDTAKQFGRWEMSRHPEIRMARDIPTEHYNEWLQEKALSGSWGRDTVVSQTSQVRTLVGAVQRTYGRSQARTEDIHDYRRDVPDRDGRVRDKAVERADCERLLRYAEERAGRSQTLSRAVQLSYSAGLRAGAMATLRGRDIEIERDRAIIHIHGDKNGRNYDVYCHDKKGIEYLSRIKTDVGDGLLFKGRDGKPMRPQSIDKSVRRAFKSIGLDDKYADTTVHALRKEWAQREYDRYRNDGHTMQESKEWISIQLGHNDTRAEDTRLLARYVERVW